MPPEETLLPIPSIDPGWASALRPVEPKINQLTKLLLADNSPERGFLPGQADVLRAFTFPFAQTKVLLVGQDPYPTPGHAMGLSFSVAPGVALPASLRNIFKELASDLDVAAPTTGDLTGWARQGVCLLNRVLTVRPGIAASHRNLGWQQVTQCAIEALVARDQPLVAILWGKDAQTLEPLLGATPTIKSVHPSPLSAYRGFFGSRPFSRANQALAAQDSEPIDWANLQ